MPESSEVAVSIVSEDCLEVIQEQMKTLKNAQTAALSAVTKRRNEILRLMDNCDNLHLVKSEMIIFCKLRDEYDECFQQYEKHLTDSSERNTVNKRYSENTVSIDRFITEMNNWVKESELQLTADLDRKSLCSSSTSRTKSSRTSVRSARLKEKARLAELMAQHAMREKAKVMEEQELRLKQEREEQEFILRKKQEQLELETKIAMSQARERVYAEADNISDIVPKDTPSQLNSNVDPFQPQPSDIIADTPQLKANVPCSSSQCRFSEPNLDMQLQSQQEMPLKTQQHMTAAMLLPSIEVPKFKGDPIEFASFMMAFDARIAPNASGDADKLYYLDQQLEGEAKDLIGGCLYMSSSERYTTARNLLSQEYGDPYKVSMAYIKKLISWSALKHEDPHSLYTFALFLIKCRHAMTNLSHMEVLNHLPNLQAVVKKLPTFLQNKWCSLAGHLREEKGEVDFADLVEFVYKKAKAANDPAFSKFALQNNYSKPENNSGIFKFRSCQQKSKSSSFATQAELNPENRKTSIVSEKEKSCPMCKKNHDLDDCWNFAKKTSEEKIDFLKERRLCFGCFGLNHTSKGCMKRKQYKTCSKRHPTSLHIDGFKLHKENDSSSSKDASEIIVSTCTTNHVSEVNTILQAILPVKVYQKGNKVVLDTYAFFDNGSTGCFITESLREQIGASGTETCLKLQTMHGVNIVNTLAVNNLCVTDMEGNNTIDLPKTFTRQDIPVSHQQIPKPKLLKKVAGLRNIADLIPDYRADLEIGLLIGSNCPKALQPLEVLPAKGQDSYAVLYHHQWTVSGPLHFKYSSEKNSISCHHVFLQEVERVKECFLPAAVVHMFERDFSEKDVGRVPDEKGLSQEDQQFLKEVAKNIQFTNGHYQLPLPFRTNKVNLVNNREQAVKRAQWQRRKMKLNPKCHEDYVEFVEKLVSEGYAYKVPEDQSYDKQPAWYLPHHGVYHPKKPNKIRVVFDCSAKYQGSSLNDKLMQGPDMTNSLIGVLLRFRLEKVALMGDIESMFYQVQVPKDQHKYLRFLWWPGGELESELTEYRMGVHIFGAVSSPNIANYALRAAADHARDKYGPDVEHTIKTNFYVDDYLKSVPSEEQALRLVKDVTAALKERGFRLTRFVSNSKLVLKSIPQEDRSKDRQTCDLDYDELHVERALGLQWNIENDYFTFSASLDPKPFTRRGILSTVCSLYDPLRFVAPFLLPAKRILREVCQDSSLGWDDVIPEKYLKPWRRWLDDLPILSNLKIPRCVKPKEFGTVTSTQLHMFSDASNEGYVAAAHMRLSDNSGRISTALLMGKSRVCPVKATNIPVKVIKDFSENTQWRYVQSKENPADIASRGFTSQQMLNSNIWFDGPYFLKGPEELWKNDMLHGVVELEGSTSFAVHPEDGEGNAVDKFLEYYSSWHRLRMAVAVYHRLFSILKSKRQARINGSFTAEELDAAGKAVIRYIQKKTFSKEVTLLQKSEGSRGRGLCSSSSIYKLDPFIDPKDRLLRVNGRLSKAEISAGKKHPMILPRKSHITTLIIRYTHEKLAHAGRNHVMAKLRELYWIIRTNASVRQVLQRCVICRKMRNPVLNQKMADLPLERVIPVAPFTHTGVDFFGPQEVKEGRQIRKRYGVLFTCLSTRAIHIETANSLDTSSFINALRSFVARRGNVKKICCDNGTNFHGAEKELRKSLQEMNDDQVRAFLSKESISWTFNPPTASHMGGVWERQIRTVRKVLTPLFKEHAG
ncbi:uncharacterized protein [Palaemon carinicauda]|uniref:uncharacterized protein n=1 Tax=Palaemon carinicauda TaxID=392227 RepID=UPI0035B63C3B